MFWSAHTYLPHILVRHIPSRLLLWRQLALTCAVCLSLGALSPMPSSAEPNTADSQPRTIKPALPEELLQGTIQERRARRKACATQWEHMKHTKGTEGQTWRDFTFTCYGDTKPAAK
jgi:hypothetical protein